MTFDLQQIEQAKEGETINNSQEKKKEIYRMDESNCTTQHASAHNRHAPEAAVFAIIDTS